MIGIRRRSPSDRASPVPHAIDSVIIVEDLAHLRWGHLPNRFADLADGFRACGVAVTALTSQGWAHDGARERSWSLTTCRPWARAVLRVVFRRNGHLRVRWPFPDGIGELARMVVAASEVRRLVRTAPDPERVGVVSLMVLSSPAVPAALDARSPWIVHAFQPVPVGLRHRLLRTVATRVGAGPGGQRAGRAVVAVPTPAWRAHFASADPTTRVVTIRLAGTRPIGTLDVATGDGPGGLLRGVEGRRVALLFGSGNPEHDARTAVEAFAGRSDWQLIIAGALVDSLSEDTRESFAAWPVPPVVVPGFVEGDVRDRLFAQADLVVLSFTHGYVRNSGTFTDALSYGKPVVASSGSATAELVERYGVGAVFRSGDAADLGRALDRFDPHAYAGAIDAARTALSNREVARVHLEVLQAMADEGDLTPWQGPLRP